MSVLREEVKKLKADLLRSAQMFATGETNQSLRHVLDKLRPEVRFALVFNWIPEQGEDVYWLLVNKEEVLIVDVPRPSCDEGVAALEVIDIGTFRKKKLSAETKRRFDAALEIMSERNGANI